MFILPNKIHNKIININNKEKTIFFLLPKKITSYLIIKILISQMNKEVK